MHPLAEGPPKAPFRKLCGSGAFGAGSGAVGAGSGAFGAGSGAVGAESIGNVYYLLHATLAARCAGFSSRLM